MNYFGFLLAASFLFLGCNGNSGSAAQNLESNETTHKQETAPSHVPGFDVNVVLVGEARRKIPQSRESIIVIGYVSGIAKPGVRDEDLDGMGDVTICNLKSEMERAGTFHFPGFDIPEKKIEQVQGPDFELLINAVSGRRSSKDNLLDCGTYQGGFKAVQNHTIEIECRMIGEKTDIPEVGKVR